MEEGKGREGKMRAVETWRTGFVWGLYEICAGLEGSAGGKD